MDHSECPSSWGLDGGAAREVDVVDAWQGGQSGEVDTRTLTFEWLAGRCAVRYVRDKLGPSRRSRPFVNEIRTYMKTVNI